MLLIKRVPSRYKQTAVPLAPCGGCIIRAGAELQRVEARLVEYKVKARKEMRRLDLLRRWHHNQHFAAMIAEDRLRHTCDDPAILSPERKLSKENAELHKQIREMEAALKPQSSGGNSGNQAWQLVHCQAQIENKGCPNKSQLKREAKRLEAIEGRRSRLEIERQKAA